MKKKVVLFFPSIGKLYLPIIPFAFLYLERAVRDLDVEIVINDENVGDEYVDYIKEHNEEILLVGVSAIIGMQIESCVIFSKYVKSISNIKVLWGGWLPTTIPEQILKEEYIDFIIAGQGEMPFRSFVISLLNNQSYENIKGLGFKNNNIFKVNPSEKFTFHPMFHQVNLKLVDVKKYFFEPSGTHCYSATIGCNLKCTFCTTGNVYNHNWYHKDIQQIISDLKYFKQETPSFRHLSLEDDNFFANKKFVIQFAHALISENIDIAWTASGHSQTILQHYSDEDMELIYRSGCRGVYCGAESGDKNILT